MKKIIIILLLAMAANLNSYAQSSLCDTGPCTFIEMKTEYIGIVEATCPPPPNQQHKYAVMVIVTYSVFDCNGTKTILMNDPVFIDDRAEAMANGCVLDYYPGWPIPSPDYNSDQIRTSIIKAINATVNNGSGATNGTIDMLFPGSCNSLVKLNFPAGSYFPQAPDDRGVRDTFFVRSNTVLYQSIPCGEACCKVVYEYRLITTEEGLTHSQWIPTNVQPSGPPCESFPIPDYNLYSNKIEADYVDPSTGNLTKINGTVIGQEPCEMMCPRFNMPPPPMFKTKIGSIAANSNLEFDAKPTLVEDYITVESEINVLKLTIYDISGRKMECRSKINSNKFNLSDLKTGLYYLQFELANKDVKTIKIFKQ